MRPGSWQVQRYDATFMTPILGATGRISFSDSAVGYLVPLIDDAVDDDITFPLIFSVVTTAACRVRQRKLSSAMTTAEALAAVAANGGTSVAASGEKVAHVTLPEASLASPSTFVAIGSNSYGPLVPENVIVPVTVTSLLDAWIQVRAYDGTGTLSSGELVFTCVSDLTLIGR